MKRSVNLKALMAVALIAAWSISTLPLQAQTWNAQPTLASAFIPVSSANVFQTGLASAYAPHLHGRTTASGEAYNHNDLTAAHRTLPLGTQVRVINQANGFSTIVRINDRGPFVQNRIIDVSGEAARQLGIAETGIATVQLVLASSPGTTTPPTAGTTYPVTPTPPANTPTYGTYPTTPGTPSALGVARFAVQLGSFRAQMTASNLAAAIPGSWVQPVQVNGQYLYRVYYGFFANRAQAEESQRQLLHGGHAGFVKQLDANTGIPGQPVSNW